VIVVRLMIFVLSSAAIILLGIAPKEMSIEQSATNLFFLVAPRISWLPRAYREGLRASFCPIIVAG
jgi:hypothetical protein